MGANRVHLVEELLKLMQPEELGLQDLKGNTVIWFATAGLAELVFRGRKTGVRSLTAGFYTGSYYTYLNSHAYQLPPVSWIS